MRTPRAIYKVRRQGSSRMMGARGRGRAHGRARAWVRGRAGGCREVGDDPDQWGILVRRLSGERERDRERVGARGGRKLGCASWASLALSFLFMFFSFSVF